MRIAVCGTHRAGKSTLLEELAELLPSSYVTVDEPYHQLEEEGHAFAQPPSLEDFEAQLIRSIENLVDEDGREVLFDRCPVDFLGYLLAHQDRDSFDLDPWLPRVREAVRKLDLVVFVGIESRDRIALSASEEDGLRQAVDEQLRELLLDNPHALDVEVLEVEGSARARAKQVLARIAEAPR